VSPFIAHLTQQAMALKQPLLLFSLASFWQTLCLASLEFGAGRGGSSDGPKSGACSLQLLELLGNSDFDNFTACVETKLNQSDPLLDGSSAAAYADCWCAGNVSSFIRAQDCENQRTWKWLAKVSCDDDCSSTEAQQCAATCPKKCFDMDSSKLPECQCVSGCMQHLRCLVQEAGNSTSQEAGQECSELALASSSALQTFQQCVRWAGSNSTWDLMTKKFSCLCAGDLQEEIYRHHCCDNGNKSLEFMSTGLCTANCSVDCAGEEAQECQACTRECAGSHAQKPSEECETNCLKESGRCNRYKVCAAKAEIAPAASFPYVCDDGQEPNAETGCCPGVFGAALCPLLCERQFKRTFWRPGHSYARCECESCPATREETLKLMNETLLSVYEQAAYRQLMYIVVTRHLNGMSFEMRRLYSQQIHAVQTEIILHGGYLDRMLVEQLHEISVYYFARLARAADEALLLGDHREFFARPAFGLVWLALISSIIVILTIALGCFLPKTLRRPLRFSSQQNEETQPPARMVVGRPISSKEQPDEVVEGVLVQRAQTGLASV